MLRTSMILISKPSPFLRFLPIGAVLTFSPHTFGADYFFEGNGGSSRWNNNDVWRDAANGGSFISANPGVADDMFFNITGLTSDVIATTGTASSNREAKTLNFNSTGTTSIVRDLSSASSSNSGQDLVIRDGIIMNSGAGAVSIGATGYEIDINADDAGVYIQNDSSSLLTLVGELTSEGATGTSTFSFTGSGSGGAEVFSVIQDGSSAIALSINTAASTVTNLFGDNTFTGGTTLNQGIVVLNSSSSLGTGDITLNGGRIGIGEPGVNLANNVTIGGNIALGTESGISGNASGLEISGNVDLGGGTRELTVRRTLTVSGDISNGGLTLNGVGSGDSPDPSRTMLLNGTNTYSGATTITSGTLELGAGGSIDNTSGVSLGTNGTFDVSAKAGGYSVSNLTGSGTVVGSITVSSELAIGNSPGTTEFENLTLGGSSVFTYELTGGGSAADLGNVSGTITIAPGATLDLVQLGTYTVGDKFTLFGYDGLTGTFAGLADGASFTDAGGDWEIDYFDTSAGINGGTGSSFVTVTAVPEPTMALLGSLGLLTLLRRRRA